MARFLFGLGMAAILGGLAYGFTADVDIAVLVGLVAAMYAWFGRYIWRVVRSGN